MIKLFNIPNNPYEININELPDTLRSNSLRFEHCAFLKHFKLFVEFNAPSGEDKYKSICESFVKFFSKTTGIEDEPIFVVKTIRTDKTTWYYRAIYPCVVDMSTWRAINIKLINKSYGTDFDIIDSFDTYPPLPITSDRYDEKRIVFCWLLDNGREYKGQSIFEIDRRRYLCQIIDNLPILPNIELDESDVKIMRRKKKPAPKAPKVFEPYSSLPSQELSVRGLQNITMPEVQQETTPSSSYFSIQEIMSLTIPDEYIPKVQRETWFPPLIRRPFI